jgi:hypothetical protein
MGKRSTKYSLDLLNHTILKIRFMTPRVFAGGGNTNPFASWGTEIDSVWYREQDDSDDPKHEHGPAATYYGHPHAPPSGCGRSSPYGTSDCHWNHVNPPEPDCLQGTSSGAGMYCPRF